MTIWHMKGQSNYDNSTGFHMGLYLDMNGFNSGVYNDQKMPIHVESGDPFMAFGVKTKSWVPASQQVEFGLWDHNRVRIDGSGVWGYHNDSGVWFNLMASQLSNLSDVGVVSYTDGYVLRADGDSYEAGYVQWGDVSNKPTEFTPAAHVLSPATGPHTGTLLWSELSKTGSNLTDLATRSHNDLLNINAGDSYEHITQTQKTALGNAIHDDVANEITAITPKTTPVAADEFIIEDSGASFVKKALTYGNLKTNIAPSLDEAFDIGKVIDGASSLANAMLVGDGSDKIAQYAIGGIPHTEVVGSRDWHWESSYGYVVVNDNHIYLENGCTAAQIQAAVTECSANNGGIVHVPSGTFAFGATQLTMVSNVWLKGVGRTRTILTYTGSLDGAILIPSGVDNIKLSDFKMTSSHANADVIHMEDSDHIQIDNCWFICTAGTPLNYMMSFIHNDLTSYYISITNCIIDGGRFSFIITSGGTGTTNWIFLTGNIILNFTNNAFQSGNYQPAYLLMNNNIWYSALGAGTSYFILMEVFDFFTICNNIFHAGNSFAYCIRIAANASYGIVDGNMCFGYTTAAISNASATVTVGSNKV